MLFSLKLGWAGAALLSIACLGQATQAPAPKLRIPATQPQQATSDRGAPAQSNQSADDNSQFVIKVPVNEVNLVFSVTDRGGHFIKDLKEQDFQLLDARMPPAKVLSFTQQTNLPLRVGLLIDTSSSVHSRFGFEQRSAIDFLQQVLRPRQDQAFVMGFDSSAEITQGFTSKIDALATGINEMKANGGTALYDAVYKACRDEMLPITSTQPLRKTIVLLSDGHDNQSHFQTPQEPIRMCQRAQTSVYTISTNVSPTKDEGDRILAQIAEQTGGRTFVPAKEEDLAHAFYQISEELRSQYALEYKPANLQANGKFRDIWLVATNRKYRVNTRKGYFAPTE